MHQPPGAQPYNHPMHNLPNGGPNAYYRPGPNNGPRGGGRGGPPPGPNVPYNHRSGPPPPVLPGGQYYPPQGRNDRRDPPRNNNMNRPPPHLPPRPVMPLGNGHQSAINGAPNQQRRPNGGDGGWPAGNANGNTGNLLPYG